MVQNTIVTGADEKYFRCLIQLMLSFKRRKEYRNSELVCFDLGLNESQTSELHSFVSKVPRVAIRKLDYSNYPDFVQPEWAYYSWKPIIFNRIFFEKKGNVLWMDSANVILKSLESVWKEIEEKSCYTPIGGSGTLGEWTHDKTLEYLKVPENWQSIPNRCGCLFGFNYRLEEIREMLRKWEKYCMIEKCVKPAGSGRSNHRDDQSILTILLYDHHVNHGLYLTNDRVDISSGNPISNIMVRKKVSLNKPIFLDPFLIAYFTIRRKVDIFVNRLMSNP